MKRVKAPRGSGETIHVDVRLSKAEATRLEAAARAQYIRSLSVMARSLVLRALEQIEAAAGDGRSPARKV